jgi:hypothetical protein
MQDAPTHAAPGDRSFRPLRAACMCGGMIREAIPTATLAISLALVGCREPQPDAASARPALPSRESSELAPRPDLPAAPISVTAPSTAVRIDVSRLSRVVRAADAATVIDLRIDGFDASGRSAVLGGTVRVELEVPGASPAIQSFNFHLRTLEEAARHFDSTLEQYVLRLDPNWNTKPERGTKITIRVTLHEPSGTTIATASTLAW